MVNDTFPGRGLLAHMFDGRQRLPIFPCVHVVVLLLGLVVPAPWTIIPGIKFCRGLHQILRDLYLKVCSVF